MLLAPSCLQTLRRTRVFAASCILRLASSSAAVVQVNHHDPEAIAVTQDYRGLWKDTTAQNRSVDARNHIDGTDLRRNARQSRAEKSINDLIKRGQIEKALKIYQEQLRPWNNTPSTSVTSHLLRALGKSPMSLLHQKKGIEIIIEAIEHHNVSWDTGLLATFLSNLVDAKQYDALEKVIDTYSKSIVDEEKRKEWKPSGVICSIMIKGYCEAGRMQDAVRWLQRYRNDSKSQTADRQLHSHPYITLMEGLAHRHKPFTDPLPCYTVFRQMITDKTPLHIIVFNILMALEARRMNPRRVFALYRILQRPRGSQTLQPNSTTFATLFTAHKVWRPTQQRQRRPSPTPRELFRTMLRLHHDHTGGRPRYRSPYLTASTLNIAISCFLRGKDYAAAIVALRTFGVCRLVPTTRTEWVVATRIMRRMTWDLAKDEEDVQYGEWVERMRGQVMDARQRKDEMDEISEFIKMLKERSYRASRILPPSEMAAAHLAMDTLIGTEGQGGGKGLLKKILLPQKRKRPPPQDSQINVRRLIKLVQQAMFATFAMGTNTESKFSAIMASVNSEILPPRSNSRHPFPKPMPNTGQQFENASLQ